MGDDQHPAIRRIWNVPKVTTEASVRTPTTDAQVLDTGAAAARTVSNAEVPTGAWCSERGAAFIAKLYASAEQGAQQRFLQEVGCILAAGAATAQRTAVGAGR